MLKSCDKEKATLEKKRPKREYEIFKKIRKKYKGFWFYSPVKAFSCQPWHNDIFFLLRFVVYRCNIITIIDFLNVGGYIQEGIMMEMPWTVLMPKFSVSSYPREILTASLRLTQFSVANAKVQRQCAV